MYAIKNMKTGQYLKCDGRFGSGAGIYQCLHVGQVKAVLARGQYRDCVVVKLAK